jgi:GH25 family lysozyme M1 (1,4-beta-N-acetylmuramidase)
MNDQKVAMFAVAFSALAAIALLACGSARAADDEPWKVPSTALVIDAYELNTIEWSKLVANKRVAGFISKASDGLPEVYDCRKPHRGDSTNHCKTMWRKYAVSRELYQTRRMLAKAHGMLWGAYHLARPGNPVDQANHFLDYAEPAPGEMMVLDIEGLDTNEFMSLADAEIFARHIKTRTGRYPVLYTNHVTARHIAVHREEYRLLSRLPLWYARYRPDIKGVFPMGNWEGYLLWQFSSATNCGEKSCPMRIEGTLNDIDVNTTAMTPKALAAIWGQGGLVEERAPELQHLVIASVSLGTSTLPSAPAEARARIRQPTTEVTALNYQDF